MNADSQTNDLAQGNEQEAPQSNPIVFSDVINLLEQGYVRLRKNEKGYNKETKEGGDGRSIQSHYGVNASEISMIFKHPTLKSRKTKGAKRVRKVKTKTKLVFIDDVNTNVKGEPISGEDMPEVLANRAVEATAPSVTQETVAEFDDFS